MTLRVKLTLTIVLLLSFGALEISHAQRAPQAPTAPTAPPSPSTPVVAVSRLAPTAPQTPEAPPAPPEVASAPLPSAPPTPMAALAPQAPAEPSESFTFFYNGESFLGIYAGEVNKENMKQYGLSEVRGVVVSRVVEDSPAARAGIRKDDVILRFNGEEVTSIHKLNRLISEVAPDHTARLTISRGGQEQEISVTMAKRENFPRSFQLAVPGQGLERLGDDLGRLQNNLPNGENFSFVFGARRHLGVGVSPLTKQLGEYFGVPEGRGVLINSVTADGPAAKAGLKAGDVITDVDGNRIERIADLTRELNRKGEGEVTIKVIRDKSQRSFKITPEQGTGFNFEPEINITPQVGQISLPRLAMPVIPPIKIRATPKIVLPAMPRMDKIVIPSIPAISIPRVLLPLPL
ncbi:MAG TPA: PDZ domain-containing protein [Pyrinomonadaceae bacterium]|jgi:serine protease Do